MHVLRTRAWILSLPLIIQFTTYIIFNTGQYHKESNLCAAQDQEKTCIESVNESIALSKSQFVEFFFPVWNLFMIVFWFLCYKRRYLADYIFSLLMVLEIMFAFYPNQMNHDSIPQNVLDIHFLRFLAFAVGWPLDITAVISVGLCLFVGITALYDRPLEFDTVLTYIVQIFASILAGFSMMMLVISIAKINEQRRTANQSHVELLDGMHEGLLILQKKTESAKQQFMFCNRPAQKLINRFIGSIDDCHNE